MATIRVWCGYRAAHKAELVWIAFDGVRLEALTYAPGGRTVEWVFYRARDGRAVVQEVRFGAEYDFGVVYVFSSIVEACARFAAEFARVGADLARVPECRVCAETGDAPTLTLDEYLEAAGKEK
jgi:hypothetical protein